MQKTGDNAVWIWGVHAALAALNNPKREVKRVLATANSVRRLGVQRAETVTSRDLEKVLPAGAVHQGLAVQASLLPRVELSDLVGKQPKCIAVLDQISDPHNLGAVWRSAAAFGVEAIILQTRHSPPITGLVAKTAAGAVETVLECRVVNIARTLETLEKAGFINIGMAGEADVSLSDVVPDERPVALVFGAEGAGLRPAVAKACTWLAKIPMSAQMESLNISNAAAISFYEMSRGRSF